MVVVAQQAFVGARVTDSVTSIDAGRAARLKAAGFDGVMQYLGDVTADALQAILGAGLGFMPCTYADRFDGPTTVAELQAIGYPKGGTVWLDVEGVALMAPADIIAKINAWGAAVAFAGYVAGMYVGAGCPLTSAELWALNVTRYWHSLSRVIDRLGVLAEPECGWCMLQLFDSQMRAGVWVDINAVQKDYRGRLPIWAIASP